MICRVIGLYRSRGITLGVVIEIWNKNSYRYLRKRWVWGKDRDRE